MRGFYTKFANLENFLHVDWKILTNQIGFGVDGGPVISFLVGWNNSIIYTDHTQ